MIFIKEIMIAYSQCLKTMYCTEQVLFYLYNFRVEFLIIDYFDLVNETKPAAKVGKKSNILKSWRARHQLETNYASFWQAALTSSRHTLLQLHSTYIAASIWTTFKVIRLSSVLNFGPLDVTLLTNYLSKAYWFEVIW